MLFHLMCFLHVEFTCVLFVLVGVYSCLLWLFLECVLFGALRVVCSGCIGLRCCVVNAGSCVCYEV